MSINLVEDIRSVTDLKRHTREILDHVHQTGRPVVLTVNGRADSVIIDAKVYEKQLKAMNLARLLSEAETQVSNGQTRSARAFLEWGRRTWRRLGRQVRMAWVGIMRIEDAGHPKVSRCIILILVV